MNVFVSLWQLLQTKKCTERSDYSLIYKRKEPIHLFILSQCFPSLSSSILFFFFLSLSMFSPSSLSPQMISPSFTYILFLHHQISSSSLPNKIISSLFYFTLFLSLSYSSSTFAQLFLLIDLKQFIVNRNLYSNLISLILLHFSDPGMPPQYSLP